MMTSYGAYGVAYDRNGPVSAESWPGSPPRRKEQWRHAETLHVVTHRPADTRTLFLRVAGAIDRLVPHDVFHGISDCTPSDEQVEGALTVDPWDRSVTAMPLGHEAGRGACRSTRKWVEYWQLGVKTWPWERPKPVWTVPGGGSVYLIVSGVTWDWTDGSAETSFVVMVQAIPFVENGMPRRPLEFWQRHLDVARQLTARMEQALAGA
jgi:hypothetical protein